MSTPVEPFPLNMLKTFIDGQAVGCVEGKLVKLFKQKTGSNSNGDWAIQNGELEAADGTVVPLFIKDRDQLGDSLKNRTIRITAKKGDKGVSGLYVFDDEKNDVIVRKLKVTPTATIDIIDDSPPPQQRQQQPQDRQQQQPRSQQQEEPRHQSGTGHRADDWQEEPQGQQRQQQKPTTQRTHQKAAPGTVAETRQCLMQIANMHLMCATAVVKYEAPAFKAATGQVMTESQVQGATASLFIECCKNGLHRNLESLPFEGDPI